MNAHTSSYVPTSFDLPPFEQLIRPSKNDPFVGECVAVSEERLYDAVEGLGGEMTVDEPAPDERLLFSTLETDINLNISFGATSLLSTAIYTSMQSVSNPHLPDSDRRDGVVPMPANLLELEDVQEVPRLEPVSPCMAQNAERMSTDRNHGLLFSSLDERHSMKYPPIPASDSVFISHTQQTMSYQSVERPPHSSHNTVLSEAPYQSVLLPPYHPTTLPPQYPYDKAPTVKSLPKYRPIGTTGDEPGKKGVKRLTRPPKAQKLRGRTLCFVQKINSEQHYIEILKKANMEDVDPMELYKMSTSDFVMYVKDLKSKASIDAVRKVRRLIKNKQAARHYRAKKSD